VALDVAAEVACGNIHKAFPRKRYWSKTPEAHPHLTVRNDKSGPSLARIVIQGGGREFDQTFHGLASDLSDEVEVFIKVQYGQSGEFSSRGDDQIRY
jgi:hypothetical protein